MQNAPNVSIINGRIFQDTLCSSQGIEMQLEQDCYQLIYDKYKRYWDKRLESNYCGLPCMVVPFYLYVICNGRIPDSAEFVEIFFFHYRDVLGTVANSETSVVIKDVMYSKMSIIHRLLRSYPSFVRDFHFYHKLLESGKFDSVKYSLSDDKNGRDIIVGYGGKLYELSLFTNTSRSRTEKVDKNKNRHCYGNNEIQLPLNLNTAKPVGDFKLYNDYYVDFVLDKIKRLNA